MGDGPFRGSEAVALGLVSRRQLQGPGFRRIFQDVYLPAGTSSDLLVRSQAAYLLVRELGGALAGYSAALLLGADCAPRNAPAEVIVPRNVRAQPGLAIRRDGLDPTELTDALGCRVTTPLRTAWDLARRLPLVDAVVAVDSLARSAPFPVAALMAPERYVPGTRGCRGVAQVVALADPRAESPMESRLRVWLVQAGLPAPEVQHPIVDDLGLVVARVDLAYREAKLAIEYDGEHHYDRALGESDRRRDNLLAALGWDTMRLSRGDVGTHLSRTINQVSELLALRSSPKVT